ncbi:MAG: LPS export ABC transporter periplasmic protein LptC [Desulfobacteraceae bacterium]|jgi:LPS export ABC transporter protein LptC
MAKLSIKSLPLAGIVFLLAVIGFFLLKSEREDIKELSHNEIAPTADISAEKLNITQIDPDKDTRWTLGVVKGNYSGKGDENKTARMERFRLKFQQKHGFDLELEGNSAKYNENDNNKIELSGEIKGKTSNGYMFYTEHMMINLKENILNTDEVVTCVGPFFSGTGKGLFIDLDKETLKILKDVISTFDKESLNI